MSDYQGRSRKSRNNGVFIAQGKSRNVRAVDTIRLWIRRSVVRIQPAVPAPQLLESCIGSAIATCRIDSLSRLPRVAFVSVPGIKMIAFCRLYRLIAAVCLLH